MLTCDFIWLPNLLRPPFLGGFFSCVRTRNRKRVKLFFFVNKTSLFLVLIKLFIIKKRAYEKDPFYFYELQPFYFGL